MKEKLLFNPKSLNKIIVIGTSQYDYYPFNKHE